MVCLFIVVHVVVEKRLGSQDEAKLWQSIFSSTESHPWLQETVEGLWIPQGSWLAPQD